MRKIFGLTSKQPSEADMLRLRNHIEKWYIHDRDVYYSLSTLQHDLISGLDEINEILRNKSPKEADAELQSFLTDTRTKFEPARLYINRLWVNDELAIRINELEMVRVVRIVYVYVI
jgi:hypothetical protein